MDLTVRILKPVETFSCFQLGNRHELDATVTVDDRHLQRDTACEYKFTKRSRLGDVGSVFNAVRFSFQYNVLLLNFFKSCIVAKDLVMRFLT